MTLTIGIKKVKLVMDRGFYSQSNIDALYEQHYKFLISVKNSLAFVKEKLNMVRDSIATHSHYYTPYALYCLSFSTAWNHTYVKKEAVKFSNLPAGSICICITTSKEHQTRS